MDGMEISQFTYFQQAGGVELAPISVELTYGIERICMFINDIRSLFDIPWNDTVSYGDVRHTRSTSTPNTRSTPPTSRCTASSSSAGRPRPRACSIAKSARWCSRPTRRR